MFSGGTSITGNMLLSPGGKWELEAQKGENWEKMAVKRKGR